MAAAIQATDKGEERIVVINVGGKRFETYEHTLNKYPNTLLGSQERRQSYYDPIKKEFFFERHRSSFTAILYYYQSGGILEKPLNVPEHIFLEEIEFFQLTDVMQMQNEEEEKEIEQLKEEEGKIELPHNKVMKLIWVTFEDPNSSYFAKGLAIFALFVILLSIAVFCVETLPSLDDSMPTTSISPNGSTITHPAKNFNTNIFFILNAVCTAWFTFEYVLRFLVSPNKIEFLKSTLNILDLLSILPFYITVILARTGDFGVLRVMRVIRVARVFKLTRHSRGLYILGKTLHASMNELLMLFLFLLMGVILFASAAYYAEFQENPKMFRSIPHGFWWAVVTMTTVGYGDLYPITFAGKIVGTMCALSGVLAIALPVPVIVSNFEYYYKEEMLRKEREAAKKKKLEDAEAIENSVSFKSLNQLMPKSPFLERKEDNRVCVETKKLMKALLANACISIKSKNGRWAIIVCFKSLVSNCLIAQ
ncbi:predicted protein [Nematostella vectensis]|uniref:BTB domain-containing protein n=1 Tax=Nematostella vectensis TaxID=45351 RepID=A7S4S6_NEMVE|nr:predicted protein [Nematostella vectensis]|eukprot:XP_001633400.1 predicted protein [Nematostella vectensis]